MIPPQKLLRKENIISNSSPLDKGRLDRINDTRKHTFDSISNNFGNALVDGITTGYGPIVPYFGRIGDFRHQSNGGTINLLKKLPRIKEGFDGKGNFSTNNIPSILKKTSRLPIRTRSFVRIKGFEDSFDLLNSHIFGQGINLITGQSLIN